MAGLPGHDLPQLHPLRPMNGHAVEQVRGRARSARAGCAARGRAGPGTRPCSDRPRGPRDTAGRSPAPWPRGRGQRGHDLHVLGAERPRPAGRAAASTPSTPQPPGAARRRSRDRRPGLGDATAPPVWIRPRPGLAARAEPARRTSRRRPRRRRAGPNRSPTRSSTPSASAARSRAPARRHAAGGSLRATWLRASSCVISSSCSSRAWRSPQLIEDRACCTTAGESSPRRPPSVAPEGRPRRPPLLPSCSIRSSARGRRSLRRRGPLAVASMQPPFASGA